MQAGEEGNEDEQQNANPLYEEVSDGDDIEHNTSITNSLIYQQHKDDLQGSSPVPTSNSNDLSIFDYNTLSSTGWEEQKFYTEDQVADNCASKLDHNNAPVDGTEDSTILQPSRSIRNST